MYTDEEKAIFRYKVNGREVSADPDRIRRRLFHKLGRPLDNVLKEINGPGKDEAGNDIYPTLDEGQRHMVDSIAYQATDELLAAIHYGLETHPLDGDGNGLTERQAFAAFHAWCDFVADLKKTDGSEPNSSTSDSPSAAA